MHQQMKIELIDEMPTSFNSNQYRLGIILSSMKREAHAYPTIKPEHQHIIDTVEHAINLIDDWLEL